MSASSNKKNSPSYYEEEGVPAGAKRARLQEKDVVVVVGGTEFQHYRDILCFTCDYFDAALNSGMKETETKRFEFPDKDPNEWEIFSSLLEPLSSTTVNETNVQMLLPWADMLGARQVLKQCDSPFRRCIERVMSHWSLKRDRFNEDMDNEEKARLRKLFAALIEAYGTACRYGLEESKRCSLGYICRIVRNWLEIPDEGLIQRLLSLASLDDEFSDGRLWRKIRKYIPPSLRDKESQSLLSNDMLPALIVEGMRAELLSLALVEVRRGKSDVEAQLTIVKATYRGRLARLPDDLSEAFPGGAKTKSGSARAHDAGTYARRLLRDVIRDKFPLSDSESSIDDSEYEELWGQLVEYSE